MTEALVIRAAPRFCRKAFPKRPSRTRTPFSGLSPPEPARSTQDT